MENRKCPICGGEMKLEVATRSWVCPFCDSHFDAEIKDEDINRTLDGSMFDFLWDTGELERDRVKESLDSFRYCINQLSTSKKVIDYIRTSLISDSDVATEDINSYRIDKIRPKISGELDGGESIIVYGDQAIFVRGKEFYVITDKRSIFVNGKRIETIKHSDVNAMRLNPNGGYPRWEVNNRSFCYLSGIGTKYKLQGAVAAAICLLRFEQGDRGERIKLM
jgi:hypothetical protein